MRLAEAPGASRRIRNPLWSVPVGLQLSVIYALLVAVTLALLGWALYNQINQFLVQNTAERLNEAKQTVLSRPFFGGRRDPTTSGTPADQVSAELVRELSRSDVNIAVLDDQGRPLNSTQSLTGDGPVAVPTPPPGSLDQLRNNPTQTVQWAVADPGSERQLVVLTPLTVRALGAYPETLVFLEQVASLGGADDVLNQLRFYIILGIVVGSAIGVVAGLALTRAVLRPLDRVVRTAEAISAGDLDRRLHLPPGSNEVARLGTSFDHMVDRLSAALEAQRRFVADASHELRTPITSMDGLSEMLLMGADQGDTRIVQRTARSIHSELRRLGRLVTDLLTLSRLDSTIPMSMTSLDASKLMAEVGEQMRPVAEAKGVQLLAECPGPAIVNGEPDRLKQVLLNLADNAIRYTPEGGHVTLTATTEPSTGEVRLEVQDTGPGIAPQDLPHIFDRFYRGDTSRARATGNTGLGLAIARAIVEAHGGTITAISTPGYGATFRIVLPPAQPHIPPHEARHIGVRPHHPVLPSPTPPANGSTVEQPPVHVHNSQ